MWPCLRIFLFHFHFWMSRRVFGRLVSKSRASRVDLSTVEGFQVTSSTASLPGGKDQSQSLYAGVRTSAFSGAERSANKWRLMHNNVVVHRPRGCGLSWSMFLINFDVLLGLGLWVIVCCELRLQNCRRSASLMVFGQETMNMMFAINCGWESIGFVLRVCACSHPSSSRLYI